MIRQSGKTILVVGANGVVGRAVVELALAVARVARVVGRQVVGAEAEQEEMLASL